MLCSSLASACKMSLHNLHVSCQIGWKGLRVMRILRAQMERIRVMCILRGQMHIPSSLFHSPLSKAPDAILQNPTSSRIYSPFQSNVQSPLTQRRIVLRRDGDLKSFYTRKKKCSGHPWFRSRAWEKELQPSSMLQE